jgi:predicted amidophosphoribosyltransferase
MPKATAPQRAPQHQVKTVVLIEQQRMILVCPECNSPQNNIGVKFCSNCGNSLEWDNIEVVNPQPKPTEEANMKPGPNAGQGPKSAKS